MHSLRDRRFWAAAAAIAIASVALSQDVPPPLAHFHHVHLNSLDPAQAIDFYTSKFDCEKRNYADQPAVWAQKSWLLFAKVKTAPKSAITSAIWHMGWGAENMQETYERQLASGTIFETPITDISDIGGGTKMGVFFYAYVAAPDGQLVELNTANHHRFGHIHLLSKDPIAAANWYRKEFGMVLRSASPDPHTYRGFQIAPSASLTMDNVNFIIFPMQYAKKQWPDLWKDREDFESTTGHVTDHIAFSVNRLDHAAARLRNDGVKVLERKGHSLFIEGPDHVRIEVSEVSEL